MNLATNFSNDTNFESEGDSLNSTLLESRIEFVSFVANFLLSRNSRRDGFAEFFG